MRSLSRRTVASVIAAALVILSIMLPDAAARAKTASAIKYGGTLVVAPNPSGSWTRNFNPLLARPTDGTQGFIYEPLVMFNQARGGRVEKWLVSRYAWAHGDKTLTFQLHRGVRWSDGKPFTSADVKFTVDLAKKYPAVACGNCWSVLKNVTTPNATTVVFNFKSVNTTMLYYLGLLYTVPQHIWSKVGDPLKYTNPNPVGTGPFKLGSFSPQVYTLVKNPLYWQKGKPYIHALRFPAFTGNDDATLSIVKGEVDWGGVFIPDAAKNFVAADPADNHYWYTPFDSPRVLWLNDTEAPFSNVHVRRAISLAIDRQALDTVGEYGYAPPTNAGFIQPQFVKKWGNPSVVKAIPPAGSMAKAKAELAKAGNIDLSKPLKLNVVDGWTDWDTSVTLIANDLKQLGFNVQVNPLQFGAFLSDIQTGAYDMSICWSDAGPTPFYNYRDSFMSSNASPIGTAGGPNWGRYKNPALDAVLNQYIKTTSVSKQVAIMKRAEKIVATDVPDVPLFAGDEWYTYNTKRFVGWPNAKNPYQLPAPFSYPYVVDTVLHLHLK